MATLLVVVNVAVAMMVMVAVLYAGGDVVVW